MKKLVLIIILNSALCSAQNQRFMYDYKFVKDTLEKTSVSKELMYLDISKDGSKFYSRDAELQDSIKYSDYEKQIQATGSMNVSSKSNQENAPSVRYKVLKTYPNYEVKMESSIGRDIYSVIDQRQFNWKILNDKEKIGEFYAQKATVNFAGRFWTAWFSTDLPFQDGPYKFHGLPGLIIKMEDDSKTHIYQLAGVTKYENPESKIAKFSTSQKPIVITEKQFSRLFIENRINPAKDFLQMFSTGELKSMKDANGSSISTAEIIKKIETQAKIKNAKDNNNIEIDLLKLK